jgi:NADP-dependent aldehyde dehydrogenase
MAHHAHVGTAEIMGGLIVEAVKAAGLPEGTFSLLMGEGRIIGQQVAKHPALRAIGFTGSRAGGRALMDTAAARPTPIPVYAEMSSVNPVVLLEGALAARGETIATGLVGSCTLGVGQFCTQPGLIVLVRSAAAEAFVSKLSALFTECADGVMLTAGIHQAYQKGVATRTAQAGVKVIAQGKSSPTAPSPRSSPPRPRPSSPTPRCRKRSSDRARSSSGAPTRARSTPSSAPSMAT